MKLIDEIKQDNKKVAGWLLHYHERKRDYEQTRQDILEGGNYELNGQPKGNKISDMTGQKAQRLAKLERTEKWLKLIEEVEKRLPWKMQIVLRLKRQYKYGVRGRPVRWRIALELSEEVSKKLNKDYCVGEDQVDKWWQRIIEYTARLAAKRGLL